MIRKIIILFLVIFCSIAHAAEKESVQNKYKQKESYEEEKFKNWSSVKVLLNERGIKEVDIDWQEIEEPCLNIQSSISKMNKCRYEKALNQSQYKTDKNYCNTGQQKTPYNTCMIELGWNNPDSWIAGKRDEGNRQ